MSTKPICIIPARGGSKRFPGKNIALLQGKPLLAYAVEAAKDSGVFDCVCVSSDDPEILRIAKEAGADRVIMRPPELARDDVSMKEVCMNLLNQFATEDMGYDSFGWVIPISPLRLPSDIQEAYKIFIEKNCNSVMSVVHCDHPPQQCVRVKEGMIEPFIDSESMSVRSQELEPLYRHNGAIIFAKTDSFLREKTWYGSNVVPYVMPLERSVDIDSPLDLEWAEFLLSRRTVSLPVSS